MLFQVGEFCERVETDLSGLADELQELTGRFGDQERRAWMTSLPKLSTVLAKPDLSGFHLSLGNSGHVAFEYRLPASSAWCDTVLLGRSETQASAVILELKDWELGGATPGPRETLINHHGRLMLHPSDQVRGYVEYCRYFHSAVSDFNASVEGCVYFTRTGDTSAYQEQVYHNLVQDYPVFSYGGQGDGDKFVSFLKQRLAEPYPEFAHAFDVGVYRQDRSFVRYVAEQIGVASESAFVLLDEQRRGFEYCLSEIDRRLEYEPEEKHVVIIQGPPGSGKSVLAAHLWRALALDERIDGNVVFMTTSGCQRKNWEELFKGMAGSVRGKGLVLSTNQTNPGLTSNWKKRQEHQGKTVSVPEWKANLELFLAENKPKLADDTLRVTIVDEAHALIDPTAPRAEGVQSSGWSMLAGPQAYHVMRCSQISIFLMDGEQSYRDNETTKPADIHALAKLFGIENVVQISLEDSQYRCGGSIEYLRWLDKLLGPESCLPMRATWNRHVHQQGTFHFEIVADPFELDEKLASHFATGRTVRVGASYARAWKTKKASKPHELPCQDKDFCISVVRNGETRMWSRIWNFVPGDDYSVFIQAPQGSAIAEDPLCEVGCPYVIRGFDYDYLGVLWLNDLVWRGNTWVAQTDYVHDTALRRTRKAARGDGKNARNADASELIKRLQRGYRILLSRAIHGIYLWVEDEETRLYLKRLLAP